MAEPLFYYSSKSNPIAFYGLYFVFRLNDQFLKNRRLQKWLWDLIKCELFYVAGKCKHSGNCCKTLMIYKEGQALNTPSQFQKAVQKNPIYQRFLPVLSSRKKIDHYQCSCLTKDNHCSKYETRPSFCRNYPLSNFLNEDRILPGCGFFIARKDFRPRVCNLTLKKLMEGMICYQQ